MKKEHTILILEQKPENSLSIQKELEKCVLPFSIKLAPSLEIYQAMLHSLNSDLVIIDATVSVAEGLSAFQLSQKSFSSCLPVFFIVDAKQEGAIVTLMQAGATDFLLTENLPQLEQKVQLVLNGSSCANPVKQQSAQQKQARMLKKITDLSLDIICTVDQHGKLVSVSPASKLILDYWAEELIGMSVVDLVSEEDKGKTQEAVQNLRFGIDIINFEICCLRKNGAEVTLLWSVRWDAEDELGYGVAKDITNIKKAEEQLRRKEQRFRGILQNSADGLVLVNVDGGIIEMAPAAKRLLKFQEHESGLRSIMFDFIHSDDHAAFMQVWEEVRMKPFALHTLEFRFSLSGQHYKWLEATFHNQLEEPSIGAIVINSRDITQRKEAEIALRAREASLKEAQALGHIGNWEMDLATRASMWSEEMFRIYGINEADCNPSFEAFVSFVHPDDKAHVLEQLERDLATLQPHTRSVRIQRPSGETRYLIIDARFEFDETGKPVRIFGIQQDVTDRKAIEIALEQSKERYRQLFNLSPIPMWVFDTETLDFVDVNEAAIRHYGYSRKEFLSMNLTDIRPKEDLQALQHQLKEAGKDGGYHSSYSRHVKKSGEVIHVQVHGDSVDIFDRKTRVIVATDITDRVRYTKAIEAQNAKLRKIAWLQSHKVRAPLARIMALVDVLSMSQGNDLDHTELLHHVQNSAYELDEIIREIVKKAEQVREQTYMDEKEEI